MHLLLLQVGAQVVYSKYAGTEVELNDYNHLVLKEDDIIGILETGDVKDMKPLNDRVLIKVAILYLFDLDIWLHSHRICAYFSIQYALPFRLSFNCLTLVFNTTCFAWCFSSDRLLKLKTKPQVVYCLPKLPRRSHLLERSVAQFFRLLGTSFLHDSISLMR